MFDGCVQSNIAQYTIYDSCSQQEGTEKVYKHGFSCLHHPRLSVLCESHLLCKNSIYDSHKNNEGHLPLLREIKATSQHGSGVWCYLNALNCTIAVLLYRAVVHTVSHICTIMHYTHHLNEAVRRINKSLRNSFTGYMVYYSPLQWQSKCC